MPNTSFFPFVFLALLSFVPCQAQETGGGALHVLRPIIHAEQEEAELCLEFDHPLDDIKSGHISGNVRLESAGRSVSIGSKNLGVNGNQLCLSPFDHRRDYRLIVSGLRGAKGEKLSSPYSFSFTVPGRQPSLAFAGDPSHDGVIRWKDSGPILRVLNVGRVHVELYHIVDSATMAEAWQQRLQTALAPSESAYFARHNGKLVWQGELALEDAPDKILKQKLQLKVAEASSPGLYLVTASATDDETKTSENGLAPLAATWLSLSDLKIHAVRGPDGYYVFATKDDASGVLRDVHLLLEDRNGKILVEGKTDSAGVVLLPLPEDKKRDAVLLMGLMDSGDVDFIDLTQQDDYPLVLTNLQAALVSDKPFYFPGATVNLTLNAHDLHGHTAIPADSQLQILRPDRTPYARFPVPPAQGDGTHISFTAPAGNGAWPIIWQQADGRSVKESSLRLTSNVAAPRLDVIADRPMLSGDGEVNLTLKSLSDTGQPAPYITGRIFVAWDVPDHLFPNREDYHFGSGGKAVAASSVTSFMTDSKGMVQAHINLSPPDDGSDLHAALITVQSDPAAGTADPSPVILPVRPKDFIIGIKPMTANRKFTEDSLARFDILALDQEGKRRAVEKLTYQIYEEGRSFDWYRANGWWDYRPLQQQRRVGGGEVDVTAEGANPIEWPVTAGMYRLEVTDNAGIVRTSIRFNAGWGLAKTNARPSTKLVLTAEPSELHDKEITKISFKLDQPSMVTAFVADDRIRKVIHQFKSAGNNTIDFLSEKDWGDKVSIRVEAESVGSEDRPVAGQIILAKAVKDQLAKTANAASLETSPPLVITGRLPALLKTGETIQFVAEVQNILAAGTYHYILSATPGLKISDAASGGMVLAPKQNKNLSFAISAVQTGAKTLKLDITGPHNFHASAVWPIAVLTGDRVLNAVAVSSLPPGQSWSPPHEKTHAKPQASFLASGSSRVGASESQSCDKDMSSTQCTPTLELREIFIGAQPLFDFPQILSMALRAEAFTTREIANKIEILRLWHDLITRAGLVPELAWQKLRDDLLMRLLSRQKPDGGFPAIPDGDVDLLSTAAALEGLSHVDLPVAQPAIEQAVNELRHRLENSWFDEKERPDRAAVFAALASTNNLDAASLHYFADTSIDKSLPPLAAVQLATAFAAIKDQDKAKIWFDAAHIQKNVPDISRELLPLLAENNFSDPHDLLPALEKLSAEIAKKPSPSLESMAAFLRAMWQVQSRAGAWRVTMNKIRHSEKNIMADILSEKNPLTLYNSSDKLLYFSETHEVLPPDVTEASMTRHIYRLDGSEVTADALNRLETYLVLMEGPWPSEMDGQVFVHDDAGPALQPVGCAINYPLAADESLAWIKNLSLTASLACEKSEYGIDAAFLPQESKTQSWRLAWLARTEWGGSFDLTPITVRSPRDNMQIRQQQQSRVRVW